MPSISSVSWRAHLLVRVDSKLGNLADLQDKTLAIPQQTREHCQLFLRRHCLEYKKEPATFFAKITAPANLENALDDVVDGVVHACVVDDVGLDCYKRRKPGRFTKLRIVQSSEIFPAAVVAFRPGILDAAILQCFREGMIQANRTTAGRQLMTLWKLTGFEQVPTDYDQTLTEIVKVYPRRCRIASDKVVRWRLRFAHGMERARNVNAIECIAGRRTQPSVD